MDGPSGPSPVFFEEGCAVAFFDSRASRFLIDDAGGVRRDLSAYLTEVGGLPGARGLTEVTALGDDGVSFVTGLEDASITLRGLFDDSEAGGPDAVLGPLRAHESAVGFEYGPTGARMDGPRYSGICWVVSYELRSRVGRLVEWTAGLQVDGAVARSMVGGGG